MTLPRLLLALCVLLAAASASAQATVYRCGNAYSQEPCPGGKAVTLEDSRSADQVQQARDTAQREAAQSSSPTRERSVPSAKSSPSGAAGIRHATEPAVGTPNHNGTGKKPPKPKTVKLKKPAKKSVAQKASP